MKRRTEMAQQRHTKKKNKLQQLKPGHKSLYARKKAWLNSHCIEQDDKRIELWGFNIPNPKPWK